MQRLIIDQQELVSWVRDCQEPMDIAVAFWGKGAVKQLGLDKPGRKVRILLELDSGGSNPYEVRELLARHPKKVRSVPRLHAKCLISPKAVVIGSANASANGLGEEGFEASHWHELGCQSNDSSLVARAKEWFEGLWANSRSINDVDLDRAEERWRSRQKARPPMTPNGATVLEQARLHPEAFANRGIYVCVTLEDLSEKAKAKVKEMEKREDKDLFVFEAWPQMPLDSKLICFTKYEGKFEWDEPKVCYTGKDRQSTSIRIVHPTSLVELGLTKLGTLNEWLPLLKRAEAHYPGWRKEGGLCLPLNEFARMYGQDEVVE